ncbi:MAG: NepR family anti-sigma factor [Pseudomonadota bacterium]
MSTSVMKTTNGSKVPDETPAEGADAPEEDTLRNDPLLVGVRKLYDDIAAEPLPDHLLDLLDKLDKAERSR